MMAAHLETSIHVKSLEIQMSRRLPVLGEDVTPQHYNRLVLYFRLPNFNQSRMDPIYLKV